MRWERERERGEEGGREEGNAMYLASAGGSQTHSPLTKLA
jgi:hypothetical protein